MAKKNEAVNEEARARRADAAADTRADADDAADVKAEAKEAKDAEEGTAPSRSSDKSRLAPEVPFLTLRADVPGNLHALIMLLRGLEAEAPQGKETAELRMLVREFELYEEAHR
jgi:hypothetical protein